jgi:hypothetical protein
MEGLRLLPVPLLAYGLLAGVLSWAQRGYFNADFVAYATVARRVLAEPASSVTAYWSPLFSWLMAPLLKLGVGDLVAGRLVLVAAGAIYVAAVYVLALQFAPREEGLKRLFVTSAACCAVVEGALWSTHFLNPDLLANAILFPYLILLWQARPLAVPGRALLLGGLAGLAYLAKAYMLPFLLLHLPLVLLLSWLMPSERRLSLRASEVLAQLRGLVLFGVGLGLVAGFWIVILSQHYGHLTLSTAGPANHANVGPDCFLLDPLWNPPMEAEFILNPHYGPDWSPLNSMRNFQHQLCVVGNNTLNALGHLSGWLAMVVVAAGWRFYARRTGKVRALEPEEGRALAFLLVTLLCYVSGYALINLEARYLVPTMAPPLCVMALSLVCPVVASRMAGRSGIATVLLGVALTLPFAVQDIARACKIAVKHSQSTALEPCERVALELREHGWLEKPFAASTWTSGLNVAYAGQAIPMYVGRPKAESATGRATELEAADARVFLDFVPAGRTCSPPLPESSWRLSLSVPVTVSRHVDVYVRSREGGGVRPVLSERPSFSSVSKPELKIAN